MVMATQSPILLDHFEPEDVIVADRVNGEVAFTRLDSASLEVWLEAYSLGQLWEKNEIGGPACPIPHGFTAHDSTAGPCRRRDGRGLRQ